MDLGSILLLVGIIGIVGVGVAVLAKYTGVLDVLNLMLNFVGQMFQQMTRILLMAPRWIQIGVFLIAGIGVLGLVANWIVASDVVCSDGTAYRADSFISSITAKMLPGQSEKSLQEKSAAQDASNENGSIAPNSESPGLIQDVSLLLYDPSTSIPRFKTWGTFVAYGNNVSTVPDLPLSMQTDLLMVLPSYTQVAQENITTDRSAFNSNISIFKFSKKAELRISRATYWTSLFTSRLEGRCYMDDAGTLSFFQGAPGDDLAEIDYEITTVNTGGRDQVVLNIQFSDDFGSGNLNNCPDSGIAGEVLLRSGKSFVANNGNVVNVDDQQGFVSAKYFSIQELGVDPADILESGEVTRRASFIQQSADEFSVLKSSSADTVTYSCDENDNVGVLVWGLDVFDPKTLIFLVAIVGIFLLLGKLNLI